jgi:hypothetical protein
MVIVKEIKNRCFHVNMIVPCFINNDELRNIFSFNLLIIKPHYPN